MRTEEEMQIIEVEQSRKAILRAVDNFLSDVDHPALLNAFSLVVDTLHECLRLQEPKDYEALQRLFEDLREEVGR